MSTTGRSYGPPGTEQLSAWDAPTGAFRPVQYLGSKLRVLDALSTAVDRVDPMGGRLLDLFSGTGVVAAHFSRSRPVLAVDIQEYARVLAAALMADVDVTAAEIEALVQEQMTPEADRRALMAPLLTWESSCLDRAVLGDFDPICTLVEDGSIARHQQGEAVHDADLSVRLKGVAGSIQTSTDSVLTRYYGGVYFGYGQALGLDRLAVAARSLASPVREIALAAVLSTASDLVSSVGSHFAQPMRMRTRAGAVKPGTIGAVLRRRALSPDAVFSYWLRRYRSASPPRHDGLSVRADFRDQLASPKLPVSVIYADPPYTRDHYSRYYHVLETIACGDEPGLSTMRVGTETLVARGLYRADRHQSPFCIKSQAPQAFAELLSSARRLDAPLVLSYSPHGGDGATRERVMAIGDIERLAREHYSRVETVRLNGVAHSKLNAARLNSDTVHDAERLLICSD